MLCIYLWPGTNYCSTMDSCSGNIKHNCFPARIRRQGTNYCSTMDSFSSDTEHDCLPARIQSCRPGTNECSTTDSHCDTEHNCLTASSSSNTEHDCLTTRSQSCRPGTNECSTTDSHCSDTEHDCLTTRRQRPGTNYCSTTDSSSSDTEHDCLTTRCHSSSSNIEHNCLTTRSHSIVHKNLPGYQGRYQVRMVPYQDAEFSQPFAGNVNVEVNQQMFVEIRVEGVDSRQFATVVDTCWATPENDPHHSVRWDLISGECPSSNDDTVELLQNGVFTSSRFSFRMFVFTVNFNKVYLHCSVHLCLLTGNHCSTHCDSGYHWREGRSAEFHDSSSISMGPLMLSERNSGDKGYPLTEYLVTPLANPATEQERRFNTAHIRTRSTVERCIGLLKGRWLCLGSAGGALLYSPQKSCDIILASGVLHNIAQGNGVPDDVQMLLEERMPREPWLAQPHMRAVQRRQELVDRF
ncbi:pancreatic secretory granule membrane major glyco GP2-like protein [Labeo rohita]|uniref:Pancreatic secretory granule membrane major glyco GP2-like protein n=1 Tax=Labeo rohita TaxID=84645 RepID=A0A498MIA7_LABRO|nr:pancreatic secretory granule membrane major glyco GP2-like protein [Labeo rohita]